ncbi:MAG: 2Fe-2S iron-sulfur cluster-binding protein, partial [Hyphomicrobiaceae bacterium]
MTGSRLPSGGRIDRRKAFYIDFDGRSLEAFAGDTLASALLAGGQGMVARSFKYHRPRGIYGAGVEEPNALVHLRSGDRGEPNARATTIEAYDGLIASSQNAWPSLKFDVAAVNNSLSPLLSAGFYYKTFVGPFRGTRFWMLCERFIRKAAGMGTVEGLPDPDTYERVNAFCDLLVVGSGPSGLRAALTASRTGADVLIVEQDFELGGSLLSRPDSDETDVWLGEVRRELAGAPNVRILCRTTAFGAYDGNVFGLVEKVSDHLPEPVNDQPRQRYWIVRARQAILATGAIERPMVFGNNDLPGVMLASALRSYVNRYAVLPGRNIVLSTNNDSAYQAAIDLARAGAKVTLCDTRRDPSESLSRDLAASGVILRTGFAVLAAKGRRQVAAALLSAVDSSGRATGETFVEQCDTIGVAAGWTPVVHLWSQRFKALKYDESAMAFVPGQVDAPVRCAGRMTAAQTLDARIASGRDAAARAIADLGLSTSTTAFPELPTALDDPGWSTTQHSTWIITNAAGKPKGKAFVDLQHDVKLSDVDLAHREGYISVEHLKRYTTTGMATDQGKTSNMNALARMAELLETSIPQAGTTTFRPPYTPITFGAIAGHEYGAHLRATRYSPIHDVHDELGAIMSEAGAWMRPWYYPADGETIREAYIREAAHVREHVGMVDVSTLGKIAVQGPDAAEFLNRIYVNGWKTLQIGRLRYGVMLREDG